MEYITLVIGGCLLIAILYATGHVLRIQWWSLLQIFLILAAVVFVARRIA